MNLLELQERANVLVEAVNDYESNLTGITVDENEILEQHIYLDTHSLCSIFNYIFGKNWSDKSTNNPESTLTNDYPFFIDGTKFVWVNPGDFTDNIELEKRVEIGNIFSLIGQSERENFEYLAKTQGIQNPYYRLFVWQDDNPTYANIYDEQRFIPHSSIHPYDAQLIESEVANLRLIDTTEITNEPDNFILQTQTGINLFTMPESGYHDYGQPFLVNKELTSPYSIGVNQTYFGVDSLKSWKYGCCDQPPLESVDKLMMQYNPDMLFKVMVPAFPFYYDTTSSGLVIDIGRYNIWQMNLSYSQYLRCTPKWGSYNYDTFTEDTWWDCVHTWFELVTKQRRAGCKAAGVDFLPGAGDTDDQGVALAVILAHCKPVLENFYFPDNLEKFYSEDGSKAAELADLFLTTCDTDSDITDEAFFTTDNTTADTESGEQNTDRSCKNRFTYEMLANVYNLPL